MKGLFYRRKILLALVQAFEGKVSSIEFQKYLFLFSNSQGKSSNFQFVPYKHGCVSFQSYADKRALTFQQLLYDNKNQWVLRDLKRDFYKELKESDRGLLMKLRERYSKLKGRDLVKMVYQRFPYYAIKSEEASAILSKNDLKTVEEKRPSQASKGLFTIGYEGRSIDEFLNLLIKNNIQTLFDVRKNPVSRKYGFSKSQLQSLLGKLYIEYIHLPELGIHSKLRKGLKDTRSYQTLFKKYKKEILPYQEEALLKIRYQIKRKNRVAITCFEREPEMCHRSCIVSQLKESGNSFIRDL